MDLDRNFQHAYPYYAPDAGPHMVSEPESRALMDYVLAHRNIAGMISFGGSDNLVGSLSSRGEAPAAAPLALPAFPNAWLDEARDVGMMERPRSFRFFGFGFFGQQGRATDGASSFRPPSRRPNTTVGDGDREYYGTIAGKYRELTGIETLAGTRAAEGAFHDYGYFQFGVPSFSTPGWGIDATPAGDEAGEGAAAGEGGRPGAPGGDAPRAARPGGMPAGAPGGMPAMAGMRSRPGGSGGASGADAKMLKWMDDAGVDGFVAWTSFNHPQLGPVEIGGFRPYATTNPPADRIAELGAKNAEFALYLASLFPSVRIAGTSVTDHGGGLYEVKAEIENAGYLPTALGQGVTARTVAPTMVQLGIDPDMLVTGDAKTSYIPTLDGSGNRHSFTWLVRGRRGQQVELKVLSQKAGRATTTVTLR